MNAIEACTTVLHIELELRYTPIAYRSAAVRRKLQVIATRNRELARFVADPRAYPTGNEMLALMGQFDNCPTGRYMLARCFPEIYSFFKIKSDDSSTTGPKKRKKRQ